MTTNQKAQRVVSYTNSRIANWYLNALIDYNVKGKGEARYDEATNSIVIDFVENGESYTFQESFWMNEPVDFTFNVWMEHKLDTCEK